MSAIFGTYYNIDKDGGSGGDILTFEAEESYMGRAARQLDDAVVTGDSEDECTIHVSQQGHEFVEFDENLNNFALTAIPYDETYASFDIISNSKYLSFVMDNEDPIKPHYSIGVLIVDEDLDGTLRGALRDDVPARADGFVMCLRDIAQDMTFGDWQDFWLDMGIRIYDAEEEWDEDFTDITDDLEDD